jgi:hypothetical protein
MRSDNEKYEDDAYEYAESMSMYSFPSGSHTLCPISISCAGQGRLPPEKSHSLGTECPIKDDRNGVIAGKDWSVAKRT